MYVLTMLIQNAEARIKLIEARRLRLSNQLFACRKDGFNQNLLEQLAMAEAMLELYQALVVTRGLEPQPPAL